MAQNNLVTQTLPTYGRVDFTALRARLNGVALHVILDMYYSEDEREALNCTDELALKQRLAVMLNYLVEYVCGRNPNLAANFSEALKTGKWSSGVSNFLIETAERDLTSPHLEDRLSAWLLPRASGALAQEGLITVGDLVRWIRTRGPGWFRPIPRMGQGKATSVERWLAKHARTLGELPTQGTSVFSGSQILEASLPAPIPIERVGTISASLDGREGTNRAHGVCQISARNDLEALQAYLYRYQEKPKTFRAYTKELERFLLWCVMVQKQPLSSIRTSECEAYKRFLADPPADWIGRKLPRTSKYWRPFAGALSAESQRYAVRVLRTFFEWLVRVRYLDGNPWITVPDPLVIEKEVPLAIDKALPMALWLRLVEPGGVLDQACSLPDSARQNNLVATEMPSGAQYRLARAAIFLIGLTGIRREEAARARFPHLSMTQGKSGPIWELRVQGKRMKLRSVFLPARALEALNAHWGDRQHPYAPEQDRALLSPLQIPKTEAAVRRHLADQDALTGAGFQPDGLYRMLKRTLIRMAQDPRLPLSDSERSVLAQCATHALRHTFATHAVAKRMPLDVLQRLLGHSNPQTTAIYVQAERTRSIEEVHKLYAAMGLS